MGNWEKLKNGISQTADEILDLKKKKQVSSKPCMTNEIIELIDKMKNIEI